jgi:hypothetical protein
MVLWCLALPQIQFVMRGLDPRIHREKIFRSGWIAGSGPAMTNGK